MWGVGVSKTWILAWRNYWMLLKWILNGQWNHVRKLHLIHSWDIFGQTPFLWNTWHVCRHKDQNLMKKHSLHKRRHGLSIDGLLYDINHIWHVITTKSGSGAYCVEEFLSLSSKPNYLSPKVFRLKSRATFWKRRCVCLHYCWQCYHCNISLCK